MHLLRQRNGFGPANRRLSQVKCKSRAIGRKTLKFTAGLLMLSAIMQLSVKAPVNDDGTAALQYNDSSLSTSEDLSDCSTNITNENSSSSSAAYSHGANMTISCGGRDTISSRTTHHHHQHDNSSTRKPSTKLCLFLMCCLLLGLCLVVAHVRHTLRRQICFASSDPVTWQLLLMRHLPLKAFSRFIGFMAQIESPHWLCVFVLRVIATKLYRMNMQEAMEEDIGRYSSLMQLFTRQLKEGVRPIHEHKLVAPSDGKILYVGRVHGNEIEQVKGVKYSLKTFTGCRVLPRYFEPHSSTDDTHQLNTALYTVVIYLAPGDYHHFHSPTEWQVKLCRHFPGELMSVDPRLVRNLPGLFALNERVLVSGVWEHGFFSLTAVGAMNVGSIHMDMYPELKTNVGSSYQYNSYTDKYLARDTSLSKGDYIGGFNFGSSIVLIFEAPLNFEFSVSAGERVKYGVSLGH